MGQLCIGCPDDAIPGLPHPQTEVHVVEGHRKGLVQAAHLIPHTGFHQQAGTGHAGEVLHGRGAEQIAAAALLLILVAVARVAAQPRDDARMLQRLVRVEQLCTADGRSAGVGALPQQLGEPVAVPHLHVVVQQQQVLALRRLPAKVVDGREVEALFRPGDHFQALVPLLSILIIGKGGRVGGVVLDDDDLEVVPLGL